MVGFGTVVEVVYSKGDLVEGGDVVAVVDTFTLSVTGGTGVVSFNG